MGFIWSYWGLERAYRARVQEYEVDQALRGSWPRPGYVEDLLTLTFWGRTDAGRGLMVLTRRLVDQRWDWQIVDVVELSPAQDAELAKWEDDRT